ncbi:MAG: GTP cyclohydrolase I, partial [Oscillibacter sp.]|nr:GTP cyclohydrolase I [Oscillibacter sp.]
GVMVLVQAEHMCMTMRGIKKQGAKTVTVVTRGVFDDDERLRTDFYRMLEHC